jgi:hypothetical protein
MSPTRGDRRTAASTTRARGLNGTVASCPGAIQRTMARPRRRARAAANTPAAPRANIVRRVGSGTVWPASEKVALNLGAGLSHDLGPDPQSVRSQVFVANPRWKVGETSRERRPRRHDRPGRREPEEIAARPNEADRDKRPPPRWGAVAIEIAIRSPTGHESWKFSRADSCRVDGHECEEMHERDCSSGLWSWLTPIPFVK